MRWKAVGSVLPGQLSNARLQLHWAAQLVSAPGTSLLPPIADFSHTNLGWDPSLGVLAGRDVGSAPSRAALVFEALELVVLEGQRERASLRLAGRTWKQALGWLGEHICDDPTGLSLPAHEMPSHPVGEGAAFSDAEPDPRVELAAWFANATASIRIAVGDEPAALAVRCWPHHFDVGSLIPLDLDKNAEEARSIGIGFSPGDGSYDQPYFYVTPWPYPPAEALPSLAGGAHWHTLGFTGAILTAERLIATPADEQPRRVERFLEGAIVECRGLLGG